MKKIFIYLSIAAYSILCVLQPAVAQNKKTSKILIPKFESIVDSMKSSDKDLQHTLWSVAVADAKSGDFLYNYNSNLSLLPASNMKIVTTGVGLLMLGADYKYKTKLEYTGEIVGSELNGDVFITGGGDPTLGSALFENTKPDSVFAQFANAIKTLGVKKINGRIVADTRFFDDENRGGSWELNDIGTDYGAGISGIQFADNMCEISIIPAKTIDGKPAITQSKPYLPGIVWENNLTATADDDAAGWDVYSSPYSDRIILMGTIYTKSKSRKTLLAIPNPAYTCAWHFNKYLAQNGIETSNRVEVLERKTPDFDAKRRNLFYTYESPTLAEIVKETNKESNNSFAETILKTIGAELGNDGTSSEGARLLAQKLEELGVDTEGFKQSDGSGLSRQDFVTTSFLCNYMSMMFKSEVFSSFLESLPIAGVDGTMKYMLRKTAAEKRVKAKSGSLSSVRSYSGYVTTTGGSELCFSFIFNNYTCRTSVITKKIEKLMIALAEAN